MNRNLLVLTAALHFLLHSNAAAAVVSVVGITEPILDSTLGTPVAGIVASRNHKEGDFVKKGDTIIELDKTLEELEVARREVVLEPLKIDFEAVRFLFGQPKSSVSKEMLEKKQAEYKVALAEYELAKEQVRKRSIVAPYDGFITELFLQVGEACQVQQPILRLVDTRQCYFICNVDARSGHGLRPGQSVNLEIDSGPSTVLIQGTISFVSPVVDAASGLMKIKVIFDNPEARVRPGVAGKLTFEDLTHASARN
jgi:RND family efflux transporter MFP subunit